MARKSFSYSEVLGFGWHVMKSNFWFFVGVWVVSFFVPYFVSFFVSLPGQILVKVMGHFSERLNLAIFGLLPGVFTTIIINVILEIGITKITLSFCDNQKPRFSTLFKAWGCFWRYIGAGLLYGLIVCGTFTLFIVTLTLLSKSYDVLRSPFFTVPFFIMLFILLVALSIKFSLCFYFVVDKRLGPIKALKASSRATEGAKWSLFVFFILCVLINVLGALCFVVGLFATFPTVMVAMTLVYRHLSKQTPELAEFGIGGPNTTKPGVIAGGLLNTSGVRFDPTIQAVVNARPDQNIQSKGGIQPAASTTPQSGPSVRPSGGIQPTQSVQPSAGIRPAPAIQCEGEKKTDKSFFFWLAVLIIFSVALAAGVVYRLWPRSKDKVMVSPQDVAVSPKDIATSTKGIAASSKGVASSSNKVALKGILYSEDKSSALIGDTIAREGDIIDGVKVIKINKDTVEFEKNGEKWTQRTK